MLNILPVLAPTAPKVKGVAACVAAGLTPNDDPPVTVGVPNDNGALEAGALPSPKLGAA